MSLEEEYDEHYRACIKIGIEPASYEDWKQARIIHG
jgi:hypothetical protein